MAKIVKKLVVIVKGPKESEGGVQVRRSVRVETEVSDSAIQGFNSLLTRVTREEPEGELGTWYDGGNPQEYVVRIGCNYGYNDERFDGLVTSVTNAVKALKKSDY